VSRICRILVVEDNEDIRDLLRDVLARGGYRFAAAKNGAEMRQALAAGDVDLVVIDVLLGPGETGFALADHAAAAGCAVIITTGDLQYLDKLEKSGHRYILKPYRLDLFMTAIEEALTAAQADCVANFRHLRRSQDPNGEAEPGDSNGNK
jgi:DNA-binding NtrC family response regulator